MGTRIFLSSFAFSSITSAMRIVAMGLALASAVEGFAQRGLRIEVGTGAWPVQGLVLNLDPEQNQYSSRMVTMPLLTAGIELPIGRLVGLGLSGGYVEVYETYQGGGSAQGATYQRNTAHLLVSCRVYYSDREKLVDLYSGAALGGASQNYQTFDNGITYPPSQHRYPAYHLTALGMRRGGALALDVEFGFGYKGIISGGVSYVIRIKRRKDTTPEGP